MANILEQLMQQQGQASLPSNLNEKKQILDLARESPEFSDLLPKGGKVASAKKDTGGIPAKTTVGKRYVEGAQLEALLKMLMSRGVTREQAMAEARSQGMVP